MRKILTLAILAMTISNIANAHYGDNSIASRYYRHEISTDEYLDSICPRLNNNEATIYHSNGTKSLIRY